MLLARRLHDATEAQPATRLGRGCRTSGRRRRRRHNANHMTFFTNRHMGQQGASQASTPAACRFYHEPDHGSEHEC